MAAVSKAAAAAGVADWRGFSDAWRRGYAEIFAIRVSRGSAPADVVARSRASTYLRWLGLSYVPALVGILVVALRGGASSPRGSAVVLFALLGTVNGGMFAAAVLAWGHALGRADTIDELLRPCPERDRVAAVIERAVDFRRQIVLPTLFALLPVVVWIASGREPIQAPSFTAILLVNICWTMFWLGNVSYWLIVPPLILFRIRKSDQLALRWNDPARTPGVRTFAEGFTYSAFFVAVAAFAVTVPRLFGITLFGRCLPLVYGWLLALSLWVGAVTQVVLYSIVRRYKLGVLDSIVGAPSFIVLEQEVRLISGRVRKTPTTLPTVLTCYDAVAGAPVLPYGTGVVVNYVAALLGGVISLLGGK